MIEHIEAAPIFSEEREKQTMDRCGEIIATNSLGFTAESFTLHQPPALGSLVEVQPDERQTIYAVVNFGSTGGLDPGRRVVRRSTEETFDSAIYQNHPQLAKTLRTEFGALLVGWRDGSGRMRQHLPAQPPPLHFSVVPAPLSAVVAFSEQLGYFRLLLATQGELPAEQLLAAHIRQVFTARGNDLPWLTSAARTVSILLQSQYDRLLTVLYGIEP